MDGIAASFVRRWVSISIFESKLAKGQKRQLRRRSVLEVESNSLRDPSLPFDAPSLNCGLHEYPDASFGSCVGQGDSLLCLTVEACRGAWGDRKGALNVGAYACEDGGRIRKVSLDEGHPSQGEESFCGRRRRRAGQAEDRESVRGGGRKGGVGCCESLVGCDGRGLSACGRARQG